MSSKAFKILVGVLVAAIIVAGGLVVVKTLNLGGDAASSAQQGQAPEGTVADDPNLPAPPNGETEILTPEDMA